MIVLTEAIPDYPDNPDNSDDTGGSDSSKIYVQCNLCLQNILVDPHSKSSWIKCQNCKYHQPLKKTPGLKELLVFGGIISTVYLATIIGLLLMK